MLVCPSCGSSRIRNGYKPALFILRIIGIRALLCDNCNFPFQAFSPFPPKNRRPKQTAKADVYPVAPAVDLDQLRPNLRVVEPSEPKPAQPIPSQPATIKQPAPIGLAVATAKPKSEPSPIVVERVAPARQGLRTEITKLYSQKVQQAPEELPAATNSSSLACPECGSHNIKRRRRNFFERTFLSVINQKPYICRKCDATFYSKPDEEESASHGVKHVEAA